MAWTDSLVDWWQLDEASGNATGKYAGIVLTDNGGVGAGTLNGRAARDFETSSNQYLSVVDSAALSLGSDTAFTIALRAQWESTPASGVYGLMSKDKGGVDPNREFTLYWVDGVRVTFGVFYSAGTGLTEVTHTGGNPTPGTPYTIICWHDPVADQIAISINDATAQTVAHSAGTNDTAAAFQIGAGFGLTTVCFDGLLGSAAYWKRVLTPAERTAYYNGGAGISFADIAFKQLTALGVG